MPSTYSSNLKIELMSTGENSGTWGNITNTNLGTALEQAVVGYGAVSYASDANLTISITNSNAAQAARALVLNVTSAVSLTGTRELVVPTIEKQYIVQNNTTGSQSITVKTSAGTGITVPNGRKAHLYVDGTNVIQMFDFVDINGGTIDGTPIGGSSAAAGAFTTLNASGATTLDGNVALGNASGDLITFPGTINSHLLFTDNTYDIGASGATRPRNLFLAGAATIGGNLSVGGTLTLTGGLILNGNVTVGDNASDTLTINSTITSNLIFTDNTYDIGASGATRPRNLFLAGSSTIGGNVTTAGRVIVDDTTDSTSGTTGSIQTDGGLGVAKALFVGTSVTINGGTANGVAYLNGSKVLTTGSALTFDGTTFATTGRTSSANGAWVASGAVMGWGAAGTFTNYIVGDTASNYLLFQVNSAEGMRLTSTGLGIGTSSPAYRLDVAGSTTTARLGKLTITNDTPFYTGANLDAGSQSFGIGTSGAGIVGFLTNNNERVRITTDGYVGIRTSSPAGFLHVAPGNAASSGAGAPIILQAQQGATSNVGGNVLIGSGQNGPGSSNGYIAFGIGSATSGSAFSAGETMRITDTGNFGFNLTTPTAVLSGSNTLLDAGNANGAEYIARRTGGGAVLATGVTSSNTGYLWMSTNTNLLFGTNNTERARITSGGDLLVGTGTAILSSANRGNITIGGSASSILALGSAQANALYIYTENTNADVWNTANGFLRFGTNNTERARITNAGSLLVGQTTLAYQAPANSIQANGSFNNGGFGRIQTPGQQIGSATYAGLYGMANLYLAYYSGGWKSLGGGTASAVTIDEGIFSFSNSQNIAAADTALTWTTRLTISSTSTDINNGYVKIGSPSTSTDEFWLQPGSTEFALRGRQAKALTFWTSDVERARITSDGNLLVGTTSNSGYKVGVAVASSGTFQGAYTATNGTDSDIIIGIKTNETRIFNTGSIAALTFGTANTERARILSGGEVLIAATALASYFDGRFNVAGRIHTKIGNAADSNHVVWNEATSGDNGFVIFGTEATYTIRGSIDYNRAGGLTRYNTTSDYRAKDIIGPVQNPGATIDALKVYEGVMKGATQSRPMLVAHEAQEHAPYAVSGVKDEVNEDGTPKFQQIDVSSLVPLLLAEIQLLRVRVAALESN